MKICKSIFTERQGLNSSEYWVLASICLILIPVIILINLLLVIAFIKTKQYKTASNVFMIVLSLSDCFAGAVPLVLVSLLYTEYTGLHCEIELTAQFTAVYTFQLSSLMILLMTVDRYVHINPNFEKVSKFVDRIFRGSGRYYMVGVAVIISVLMAVISIIFSITGHLIIFELGILVGNGTSLTSIFILYSKAYKRIQVYHKKRKVQDQQTDSQTRKSKQAYLNKFTKTLFFILLSYVACYVPFAFLWGSFLIVNQGGRKQPPGLRFAYYLSGFLIYTTGIANSAIVFYRNNQARQFLRGILRRTGRKEERQPAR